MELDDYPDRMTIAERISAPLSPARIQKIADLEALKLKFNAGSLQKLLKLHPRFISSIQEVEESLDLAQQFKRYCRGLPDSDSMYAEEIAHLVDVLPLKTPLDRSLMHELVKRPLDSPFYQFRITHASSDIQNINNFISECNTRLSELVIVSYGCEGAESSRSYRFECIQGKYVPIELIEKLGVLKELNDRLNPVYLRLLLKEKPQKCSLLSEVSRMLETATDFRKYAFIEKESDYRDNWHNFINDIASGPPYSGRTLSIIERSATAATPYTTFRLHVSQSQLERIEVFIIECEKRITELEGAERERVALLDQVSASQQIPSLDNVDQELAANLLRALKPASEESVYIYFKCWSMPDGTNWYKVGITNDLSRREKEQNVLPVSSVTLCSVDLTSAERARKAESKIHQALKKYKIDNAGNRELFELSDEQAAAVRMAIQALGTRSDQP